MDCAQEQYVWHLWNSSELWEISDRRPVGAGVAGASKGVMAPPDFRRSVNFILNRETDYAHYITTAPPEFLDPHTALWGWLQMCSNKKELATVNK